MNKAIWEPGSEILNELNCTVFLDFVLEVAVKLRVGTGTSYEIMDTHAEDGIQNHLPDICK